MFKISVSLRPASNFLGILEYGKNMPSDTNGLYKETNCPQAIGSLPRKFISVQYNFSCECGQEIAHIFWKWSVHFGVRMSPHLTLTLAKQFTQFRGPKWLLLTRKIFGRGIATYRQTL
jgi:hypothetical protein